MEPLKDCICRQVPWGECVGDGTKDGSCPEFILDYPIDVIRWRGSISEVVSNKISESISINEFENQWKSINS